MSRKECVLLLSRAIAVLQLITAMMEMTYLPERLFSLHHYKARPDVIAPLPDYLTTLYSTEVAFLCCRIAGLLVLTWVFWECGPKLARLFLSTGKVEG